MGCDGISPKLLKYCALPLYQPLHHLFCLSLSQCYVPLDWRTHLIKPILKSGDKTDLKNYKPISLLCIISKVLEILYSSYWFVNRAILKYQFASDLPCNSYLFYNSQSDVVYLDFKKAFDSVAHNELLYKLWTFGITDGLICGLWLWRVDINMFLLIDVLPVISEGYPKGVF